MNYSPSEYLHELSQYGRHEIQSKIERFVRTADGRSGFDGHQNDAHFYVNILKEKNFTFSLSDCFFHSVIRAI